MGVACGTRCLIERQLPVIKCAYKGASRLIGAFGFWVPFNYALDALEPATFCGAPTAKSSQTVIKCRILKGRRKRGGAEGLCLSVRQAHKSIRHKSNENSN